MILDSDPQIKKQTVEEYDKLPITVELLRTLGYRVYDSRSYAKLKTITVYITYKHPRKYGYFKDRCGKLQDEIILYGEKTQQGNIVIKTTVYFNSRSHCVILETMGDLKKFMYILTTNENIEAENYNLRNILKTIEVAF